MLFPPRRGSFLGWAHPGQMHICKRVFPLKKHSISLRLMPRRLSGSDLFAFSHLFPNRKHKWTFKGRAGRLDGMDTFKKNWVVLSRLSSWNDIIRVCHLCSKCCTFGSSPAVIETNSQLTHFKGRERSESRAEGGLEQFM